MSVKIRRGIGFDSGIETSVQIRLNREIRTILGIFIPISMGISQSKSRITAMVINSELLMCRKFGCNRNFRNRVNKTEFGRIVLNLIFYFGSKTKIKGVDTTFFWIIVPFIFDKLCCILNLRLFSLQIL